MRRSDLVIVRQNAPLNAVRNVLPIGRFPVRQTAEATAPLVTVPRIARSSEPPIVVGTAMQTASMTGTWTAVSTVIEWWIVVQIGLPSVAPKVGNGP
jgi:hypothetical protein